MLPELDSTTVVPRSTRPSLEGVLEHPRGRPVLGAATGIRRLELRPDVDVRAKQQAAQAHQRRVSDRSEDAVGGGAERAGQTGSGVGGNAHEWFSVSSRAWAGDAQRVPVRRR